MTSFEVTVRLWGVLQEQAGRDVAGISRAIVLRACAEQAEQMQAFKLARWAHTHLQSLHVSSAWQVTAKVVWTSYEGSLAVDNKLVTQGKMASRHLPQEV